MTSANSSYTLASVDRLKPEIDELTRTQAKVLDHSGYVEMTPVEEQAFGARRRLITKLVQKLRARGLA